MNKKESTNEFFKCLDSDSSNCNDLNSSFSPDFSFNALRAKENAVTREVGTPKDSVNPPGRRYQRRRPTVEEIQERNGQPTKVSGRYATLNRSPITDSEDNNESVVAVDEGGISRDTSTENPVLDNAIDRQRVSDQEVTIQGGNKAFPYISPLSSTNFSGLSPINPLDEVDNGPEGSLYNVKLLEDEGIVYLRQYLSFDDEETGAVWRFQYAPKISYTRSATFQEDVTWGTNVQPAHYNNTSGKKLSIQGAILEGMTIGKTVTGAVTALETLMSVVNPDNEEQVAPYAYRLIVGGRTFTEPVSGKHTPFVIENISVKEEMYDASGEVLMYKVDLSLKEVPYYQINDGRKLLLVTQDQRTRAQASCDQISADLARLDNEVAERESNSNDVLARAQQRGNKETTSLQFLQSQMRQIERNCQSDSKAYSEYIELFKQYNDKKCRTSKPIRGFQIIEELFQRDSGAYEILKGRPQLTDQSLFRRFVFNENGESVPYREVVDTIRNRVGSSNPPYEFLRSVNPAISQINTSRGEQDIATGTQDYLPACSHIRCISNNIQGSISNENIEYILDATERFFNLPIVNRNTENFFPQIKIKPVANLNSNVNYAYCANKTLSPNLGFVNVGDIIENTVTETSVIFDNTFFDRGGRFKWPSVQAGACILQIKNIFRNYNVELKANNCNKKAGQFELLEQYRDYIRRFENIFNSIVKEIESTSYTRTDIINSIQNKPACSDLIPKETFFSRSKLFPSNGIYTDGLYGGCLAAYSTVLSTKYILEQIDGAGTIEDPFEKIKLSSKSFRKDD